MNPLLILSGLGNVALIVGLGLLLHSYDAANTNLALAHDTLNTSITTTNTLGNSASKKKDKVIAAQEAIISKQSEMLVRQIELTTNLEELIVKHTDCLSDPQKLSAQQLINDLKVIQAKLPTS